MNLSRFSALLLASLLTSCTTPDSPDPAERPASTFGSGARGKNALLGTWKFDAAASTVHTVTMQANKGSLGQHTESTKQITEMSEGSVVIFTETQLTVRIPGGGSLSTEYSIQSQDANGNYVVVDKKGHPSTYSVSGNKLINPAPEMNFVSVYVKE